MCGQGGIKMKVTTINLQIVKNLGNYETMRLGCEVSVEKGESAEQAFLLAKAELQNAFKAIRNEKPQQPVEVSKKPPMKVTPPLPLLTTKSVAFESVCQALFDKKSDIEMIQRSFTIDELAMDYFKHHDLI